jgi:hypothetical protein
LQLEKIRCNTLANKKNQILVATHSQARKISAASHLQLEKYQLQRTCNWKIQLQPLATKKKELQPTCS